MSYELIKDFIGLSDCSQGYSLKELLQAERKLGKLLPVSLRKYYQCFGHTPLLINAYHKLIAGTQLNILNNYLTFYAENQGVWIAGTSIDGSPADEPAVWLSYDEGQNWEKFCDKLSEFLLYMSLLQLLEGWEYVAIKEGVKGDILERVSLNWQEINGTCPQINTRFFTNPFKTQLLAVTKESNVKTRNSSYHCRIATTNQEEYEQIVGKLGIEEWDYSSLDD